MTKRNLLIAFFALLCLAILGDWLPLLRGPAPETDEWFWPYLLRPLDRWWLPMVLTGLLAASIWAWVHNHLGVVFGLVLLTALHIGLQLGFVYADASRTWLGVWEGISAELLDRTLPPLTNGYFWDAAQIENLSPLLSDYPAQMPQFESEHSRTHPPGLILLNYGLIKLLERLPVIAQPLQTYNNTLRCTDLWLIDQRPAISAALTVAAWLPILAASASLPLTYLVAKQLYPGYARITVALVATLPALLLFAPKVDQLFVPIMLVAMLLLLRGKLWATFLAACVVSVLTFMSIGNAVIGFLLMPLWVYSGRNEAGLFQPLNQTIWNAGAYAIGGLSCWLIYWAAFGVAPWAVADVALGQHYELVTTVRRYDWWVVWNVVDIFIFASPQILIGAFFVRQNGQTLWNWTLIIGMAVLNLLGSTRGEIGRIWLFLFVLLALAATPTLAKLKWLAPCLMLALTLSIGLAWRTVRPVIVVTFPPEPVAAVGQPNAQLADNIALQHRLSIVGDTLTVELSWLATRSADYPYTTFVHVVNEDGQLVAQSDGWAAAGQWPPTCWRAGSVVADDRLIDVGALPAGVYRVFAGMYAAKSAERYGNTIEVGTFRREP
jgi:hypothetical protein